MKLTNNDYGALIGRLLDETQTTIYKNNRTNDTTYSTMYCAQMIRNWGDFYNDNFAYQINFTRKSILALFVTQKTAYVT